MRLEARPERKQRRKRSFRGSQFDDMQRLEASLRPLFIWGLFAEYM